MVRQKFRVETDSMGKIKVPAAAYYGAQTQRAILNFPVSGIGFPPRFIRALAVIKHAAAFVNEELGLLDRKIAEAIRAAAAEIINGQHQREFVVDIYQTGSGTSTNMNANEVIANRANEILRKPTRQRRRQSIRTITSTWASRATTCSHGHAHRRRSDRERSDAGASAAAPGPRGQGEGIGTCRQDRPHASAGRHADSARPGILAATPGRSNSPSSALKAVAPRLGGTRPRRHRRRHGHQHASGVCRRSASPSSRAKTGIALREADNHFEAQAAQGCGRRSQRRTENHRRQFDQDRQRHPLARLRPALRHLRDHDSRARSRAPRSCRARSTRSFANRCSRWRLKLSATTRPSRSAARPATLS